MRIIFIWILYMNLPFIFVKTQPVNNQVSRHNYDNDDQNISTAQLIPKPEDHSEQEEKIISVRITSSIAVGRGATKTKASHGHLESHAYTTGEPVTTTAVDIGESYTTATIYDFMTTTFQTTESITDLPPHLAGANIEYLKQLQAKKDTRPLSNLEPLFKSTSAELQSNDTIDIEESTNKQSLNVDSDEKDEQIIDDVPIARSIPLSYSSKTFVQREGQNNEKLTTVSFNVVHDSPKVLSYKEHSSTYSNPGHSIPPLQKYYNEPSKIYSEPAQIYSEPAKFYSEPAKIYSEPSKIYSEPAKIYSEPSKIYSEPAKFYSEPASLHLSPERRPTSRNPWVPQTDTTLYSNTYSTTPSIHVTKVEHQPEKNYEVDEKVSVMTDGRSHGEQTNSPENCKQENCKVGYVVEGRQFRKYRVEERTSDGFIVGEYGVVRNEDGALRGVRYTADSEASPRLIHDALMKFLQLK